MDQLLFSSSPSFLISSGDNSYLMDHKKRTAVMEFCNFQAVLSCWELAWETLHLTLSSLSTSSPCGHLRPQLTITQPQPTWPASDCHGMPSPPSWKGPGVVSELQIEPKDLQGSATVPWLTEGWN